MVDGTQNDVYHILRRKSDNSIKSFGPGRGDDWNHPDCIVEVVEDGDFEAAEPTLKAQLAPDLIPPDEQAKQDERVAALTRLRESATADANLNDMLKVLGLDDARSN